MYNFNKYQFDFWHIKSQASYVCQENLAVRASPWHSTRWTHATPSLLPTCTSQNFVYSKVMKSRKRQSTQPCVFVHNQIPWAQQYHPDLWPDPQGSYVMPKRCTPSPPQVTSDQARPTMADRSHQVTRHNPLRLIGHSRRPIMADWSQSPTDDLARPNMADGSHQATHHSWLNMTMAADRAHTATHHITQHDLSWLTGHNR